MEYLHYDLDDMDRREGYGLFLTAVVPRPIGWISSLSKDGVRNLAPFSFFNAVCSRPYLVVVAVARRKGAAKDTGTNIRDTGEFVVNVVGGDLAAQMVQTSAEVSPEVDEFELAGLTPLASDTVRAPRVAESPVHLECRLDRVVELGEGFTDLIFGRVGRVHVSTSVVAADGRVDAEKLRPVARLGRDEYAIVERVVRFPRPAP